LLSLSYVMAMSYPGYCAKYGHGVLAVAWLTATVLGTTTGGIAGAFNQTAFLGTLGGLVCGTVSGTIGVIRAVNAHYQTDRELAGTGIGMTRGGKIVRQAQLKNYLGPVLLGLVLSGGAGAFSPRIELFSPGPVNNATGKHIDRPTPKIPENIPAVS